MIESCTVKSVVGSLAQPNSFASPSSSSRTLSLLFCIQRQAPRTAHAPSPRALPNPACRPRKRARATA
eukprot:7319580-Prymnesium_polylepis.1